MRLPDGCSEQPPLPHLLCASPPASGISHYGVQLQNLAPVDRAMTDTPTGRVSYPGSLGEDTRQTDGLLGAAVASGLSSGVGTGLRGPCLCCSPCWCLDSRDNSIVPPLHPPGPCLSHFLLLCLKQSRTLRPVAASPRKPLRAASCAHTSPQRCPCRYGLQTPGCPAQHRTEQPPASVDLAEWSPRRPCRER